MTPHDVRQHTPRWRTLFETGSTVAMLALASLLVWQGRDRFTGSATARSPIPIPSAPVPTEPVRIDESATLGAPSAPLAVIEYADFECSACVKFVKEFKPALQREYIDTGRVRFVFKHFPLPMHQRAPVAAAAAWCADRQGKFWRMHDWLFASPLNLDDAALLKPAVDVGLDLAAYNSCRTGEEAARQVQASRSEGEALQVPATPAFFFGRVTADGRVRVSETMTGARSVEVFKEILDRLLK